MKLRRIYPPAAFVLVLAASASAQAHDAPGRLPLGDGRISSEPRRGHVMSCRSQFPGGGGAHRVGEWIGDGTWEPRAKPVVEGEVNWPNAVISVSVGGDRRLVRANNLPRHTTGEFPIRPGTKAFAYDRNPNRIREQPTLLDLPAQPRLAETPTCLPMGAIGIAVSGAAIFNALDLAGRDAPAYEIQDRCGGHPERSGQYHYHDWSPCLAGPAPEEPVGWMLDGFPILGPVDETGRTLTNQDLDACHGRVGPVRIGGRTVTIYHYRFTREYPYTAGCFRGQIERAAIR